MMNKMSRKNKREAKKIAMLLAVAVILLFFVAPGLLESPYNDF